MKNDELAMCKEALEDIIAVCDSHRGLADKYKDEQHEEASGEQEPEVAVEISAGPPPEETIEEAPEDDGPPPISIIDRPGAKIPPKMKRGPGRPRKGGY